MRKYRIDEINDFVKDLQEAIRTFERNKRLYTDEIIVEMIQSFDRLYAYLKKYIVLEEVPGFSEILIEMNNSIEMVCNGRINAAAFYKTMQKLLKWIPEELKKADLIYEIVFLPYKASMWDSFDSIWREAYQDEKCFCTVAALPYYTKQQNGLLSEKINEKEQFPDYVPVIDIEDYDFMEKQPDIIFIHNPYDEYNKITTIDPKFYSYNLKQFTKKLVYIPYFVAEENLSDEFCILPALRYVDLVIVESEKIAEQYKKNYMWEDKDKFVAWGSPKYDMIFKDKDTIRERVSEEWKERIGNRRVILYNTHLNPLLKDPEKVIAKIQYIIGLFNDRDDVVLLWRPHPLSMSALERADRKALSAYQELVKTFIQNKKGIYDDSADLSRAIAVSDAYLGDNSSLVYLFRKTGKPICIQNSREILHMTDEEKRNVMFNDAYFTQDGCWFSASTHNGLYYYDFIKQKLYFKGTFPDEECFARVLYSKIFFYDGRLIFIPFQAKKVAEYNIADGAFYCSDILTKDSRQCLGSFYQAVVEEGKIYLLPWAYKEILCYDIEKRKLQPMKAWNKLLYKYTSKTSFKFWDAKIIDGRIAAPYYAGNILFFFDLKGKRNEVLTIGKNSQEGFSSLEIYKNAYYLTSVQKKHICRYSLHTRRCEYFSYSSDIISDSFRIESIKKDNTLYLGDVISGCLFTMNLDDASFQFLSIEPMPLANIKLFEKNRLVLFPRPQDISLKTKIYSDGKLEKVFSVGFSDLEERKEVFQELFLKAQKEQKELCESPFRVTINDYIQMIAEMKNMVVDTDYIPCGKSIYEKIISGGND